MKVCRICLIEKVDTENRKIRTKKLKKKCVEYMGGVCVDCNLETDIYQIYDFHHIDPELKDTKLSNMIHKVLSFEDIKIELDKCVLLCSNCHRTRHAIEDGN